MQKTLLAALLMLTVLRMLIAANLDLHPDEAYFSMWAERPALSYFEAGPGTAVAIRVGRVLASPFSSPELAVRIFAPLLALGSSLLIFQLGNRMFTRGVAAWAVVLVNLTPMFNVGAIAMTPAGLGFFFWCAALLAAWTGIERMPRFSPWWPVSGALTGLGFLCTYANALFIPGVLLAILLQAWRQSHPARVEEVSGPMFADSLPANRSAAEEEEIAPPGRLAWLAVLRRPHFHTFLAAFLLAALPVILWNARHHWIAIGQVRGVLDLDPPLQFRPVQFVHYIGNHLAAYSPLLFVGLAGAGVLALRDAGRDIRSGFLSMTCLPLIAGAFLLSFNECGRAAWTANGFAGLALLLSRFWKDRRAPAPGKGAIAGLALLTAGALSILLVNIDLVREAGLPVPYSNDPTACARGWRTAAGQVAGVAKQVGDSLEEEIFVIGDGRSLAAALDFHLPPDTPVFRPTPMHPRVFIPESQTYESQFSFWPRYEHRTADGVSFFAGKTALYVTTDGRAFAPPRNIAEAFEDWELIMVSEIVRRGQTLRQVKIFACFNYRSLPL